MIVLLSTRHLRDHRSARAGAGPRRSSSPCSRRRRWRSWACSATSRAATDPLVDLRFFRSVPFSSSIVISVAAFAAFGGFLFLNTLYLQEARGLSPVHAGLATVPLARHDRAGVPAVGPPRRPPRPAPAAPDRRRLPRHRRARCSPASTPQTPFGWLIAAYVHLRARLRVRQRADHERRRVRDAAGPGGRRVGDRHDLPPVRPDARRRGRRRDRHARTRRRLSRRPRPGGRSRPAARSCWGSASWPPRPAPRRRPGGRRSRSIRRRSRLRLGVMTAPDSAREVWLLMSDLVLDNERRRDVAEALGISFGRARAVRRLARKPMSMGELAAALGIDPPNATVVVDDLEALGLVRRTPHPTDRRAKVVEATRKGKEHGTAGQRDPQHAAARAQRPERGRPRDAAADPRRRQVPEVAASSLDARRGRVGVRRSGPSDLLAAAERMRWSCHSKRPVFDSAFHSAASPGRRPWGSARPRSGPGRGSRPPSSC